MKKNKRSISAFNLSFLDIMFCGFGAVVLLVLVINSNIIKENEKKYQDLSAEVDLAQIEVTAEKKFKANLLNELQGAQQQSENLQEEVDKIQTMLVALQEKKQQDAMQAQALAKHINALQTDLKQLDHQNRQQKNTIARIIRDRGNKVRQYEGEGNRQYLTGLKLGGKRVLILIDSSASMLDNTIVNIILKRNMSNKVKRNTKKWRQSVNIVRWLAANLPPGSQVIIASFNETLQSLADKQSMQWLQTTDNTAMNGLFNNLSTLVPQRGTNLYKAFAAVKQIRYKPDNIILITDGLPTLGRTKTSKSKATPGERIERFRQAVKILPAGIPVNTILLPMEGDPMAASLFWKLAIDTNGSFMTPSQDWP